MDDKLALMMVHLRMGGHNWKRNYGWEQDLHLREWEGVTVSNEYRVTTLDLKDNNVTSGTLNRPKLR